MPEKLCNGCYTERCIIAHNSPKRMKVCPCQICLIKVTCIEQCEKYKNLVIGLFPTSYADYKRMSVYTIAFVVSEEYRSNPTGITLLSMHKGRISFGSKIIYLNNEKRTDISYCRPGGTPFDIYFEP